MEYKIQDDEAEKVAELRNKYIELKKKKSKLRFSIPYKIKFSLIWTLVFAAAGIIQQSIAEKKVVFIGFFGKNYIEWFNSFGNFISTYQVSGWQELGLTLLANWHYFFFTGGAISILIAIVSLVIDNYKTRRTERFNAGNV